MLLITGYKNTIENCLMQIEKTIDEGFILDNPNKRLKKVAKEYFGSVNNLAEVMGVSQQNLSQYTSGAKKIVPGAMIIRMMDLGISKDYVLNGTEPIFADNEAGRRLAAKFAANGVAEHKFPYGQRPDYVKDDNDVAVLERVDWFGRRYYGGRKELADVLGISLERLEEYFNTNLLADSYLLLRMHDNAGCSIAFLFDGTGDWFARNAVGDELRKVEMSR